MITCKICNREFLKIQSLGSHLSRTKSHASFLLDNDPECDVSPLGGSHTNKVGRIYYDLYMNGRENKRCPVCGKNKTFWGMGIGYNYETCSNVCSLVLAEERGYSIKHSGGTSVTIDTMIKKYGKEEGTKRYKSFRKKQSDSMKLLIKEGKFTPPIINYWTNFNIEVVIDGEKKKFRSTWEAVFYLYHVVILKKNVHYEKHRFKYIDEYGNNRTYVTDFSIKNDDIWEIYEIKPIAHSNNINVKLKIEAATLKCKDELNLFFIIDNDIIYDYIQEIKRSDNVIFEENMNIIDKALHGVAHENNK